MLLYKNVKLRTQKDFRRKLFQSMYSWKLVFKFTGLVVFLPFVNGCHFKTVIETEILRFENVIRIDFKITNNKVRIFLSFDFLQVSNGRHFEKLHQ